MYQPCNVNFESQFAFCDGRAVHVSGDAPNPKCRNGHDLILWNEPGIKCFIHKHSCDVCKDPMTKWHCRWQGRFEYTEVAHPRQPGGVRDRYADAICGQYVIEFQHSPISRSEVDERLNDYSLHDKVVIWVIDGADCEIIPTNRNYTINFGSEWQHGSFTSFDCVFLDKGNMLYAFNPNRAKNNSVLSAAVMTHDVFIKRAKENAIQMAQVSEPQNILYIKQQGAGNGKTFGIIQQLDTDEFKHYEQFIIVTKQHSAKHIIYREFQEQIRLGQLQNILSPEESYINKKYIITYTRAGCPDTKTVVFATIDSLMYAIGDHSIKGADKFETLVRTVIDGCADKLTSVRLGNVKLNMDNRICLICDETQDLHENYGKAIARLITGLRVDAYIVGDLLQSINFEADAFSYLQRHSFPNTTVRMLNPSNICRRFKDQRLMEFVNDVVKFDKYRLPAITLPNAHPVTNSAVQIFVRPQSRPDDEKNVEQLMKYYTNEVDQNNRVPEDFLIVTPFTKTNPLVNLLELRINMFWAERMGSAEYTRYAIFHKSEAGTAINLAESEKSTRLVSIHSSKGDGRKVVFVVGLSESALKVWDKTVGSTGIIYESMFHVAMTRMKEKLYVQLDGTRDDIYHRVEKYIAPEQRRATYTILTKIHEIPPYVNDASYAELRREFGEERFDLDYYGVKGPTDKRIIDMGHHTVRYYTMLVTLWIKLRYCGDSHHSKYQALAIMHSLKDSDRNSRGVIGYIDCDKTSDRFGIYAAILQRNSDRANGKHTPNTNQLDDNNRYKLRIEEADLVRALVPVVLISKHGEYDRYYSIICGCIRIVQYKLFVLLEEGRVPTFCPYECIVLAYMINTAEKGTHSEITITDLYNITDIYSKAFTTESAKSHTKCICGLKCGFLHNKNEPNPLTEFIKNFYNELATFNEAIDKYIDDYHDYNHLMLHRVCVRQHYELSFTSPSIAYNEKEVTIIHVCPQLNALNSDKTFIMSILESYLLSRYNVDGNNRDRFYNKQVTYVILTADGGYHRIRWDINNLPNADGLIEKIIREFLYVKYKNMSAFLYDYCKEIARSRPDKNTAEIMNVCRELITDALARGERKKLPQPIDELFTVIPYTDLDLATMSTEQFNKVMYKVIEFSIEAFMRHLTKK